MGYFNIFNIILSSEKDGITEMSIFKTVSKIHLSRHIFFVNTKKWLGVNIDRVEFPNSKKKERMIKAYLKNYISTFGRVLKEYVDKGQFNNPPELLDIYLQTVKDIRNSSITIGIPEIFLDKYDELQKQQVISIDNQLSGIVNSSFYRTNMNKISAMFDAFNYAFAYVILNAEDTLKNINGELERALTGGIFDQ
jgi:hypothetical protein